MPEFVGVVDAAFGGGEVDVDGDAGPAADFDEEVAEAGWLGGLGAAGVPGGWVLPAGEHVLFGLAESDDGGEVGHFGLG